MMLQTPHSSLMQHFLPLSQHTLLLLPTCSFSSSRSFIALPTNPKRTTPITSCWTPQVYSYNTVDRERKPPLKWSSLYRRISLMENPELGASTVLVQWEKEGRKPTRWDLCRVVKELRKYRRYKLALQVYEWMNEQGGKFSLSSSDAAIQLDLISKVHGIPSAKEYFLKLPGTLKDKRTYGSLLNAYVRAKMKEEAEPFMDELKTKGYALHPLPYNVMMTLYMKLKEFDKVISIVSEMREKNVTLDIYSYNIWLTTCGAMGSIENMEAIHEQMKLDNNINPNWTTYSTMATLYMNLGEVVKAKSSLRMVEGKISGRDRIPFHYLLSLYGGLGEKEEVYRIWNTYKSSFPNIPNLGYHTIIASLLRLDDIGGAEKLYEEWISARTSYDPRICNLLIGWYIRNGLLQKAEDFLDNVFEVGGKANSYTWELLAEGHIKEERISDALSCMKEASSTEDAKTWRPNPSNVSGFLLLCEKESDSASKEALAGLLKKVGCFENEVYLSLFSSNGGAGLGLKLSMDKDVRGRDNDDDDGTDSLLNQLEGPL